MVDSSLLKQLQSARFEMSSAIAPVDQTTSVKNTIPAQNQSDEDIQALANLAATILQNPLALQRFSERVFELLRDDIQHQHERNYGCRGQR